MYARFTVPTSVLAGVSILACRESTSCGFLASDISSGTPAPRNAAPRARWTEHQLKHGLDRKWSCISSASRDVSAAPLPGLGRYRLKHCPVETPLRRNARRGFFFQLRSRTDPVYKAVCLFRSVSLAASAPLQTGTGEAKSKSADSFWSVLLCVRRKTWFFFFFIL